jgi:hypothetical protein
VRSIQNSFIKYMYSTQNQHFAKMLAKCSLTLTILIIIWIYNILLFQFNWDFIYSAIIHVSDVSDDPNVIFACQVQRRSQRPLSTKHPEFALSVAVVDTRRVLRERETTARGVYCRPCASMFTFRPIIRPNVHGLVVTRLVVTYLVVSVYPQQRAERIRPYLNITRRLFIDWLGKANNHGEVDQVETRGSRNSITKREKLAFSKNVFFFFLHFIQDSK